MNQRTTILASMGIGMTLSCLFDPSRGRRRRALVRDQLVHGAAMGRRAARKTARDMRNRFAGTGAAIRARIAAEEPFDDVLDARVRAAIGRVVSHPHAIGTRAEAGVVRLSGPILASEVNDLLEAVRSVPGVVGVLDDLEPHKRPGRVPSLQSGAGRNPESRLDVLQRQWAPSTRFLVGMSGTAAMAYGAQRRDFTGWLIAAGGAALALDAAANLEFRRLFGIGAGRRAVDIQKTITIAAPIDEVYAFWASYDNFPRFMANVMAVRPIGHSSRSHWTIAGPAGAPVEFDAELVAQEENEYLAWRTVDGSFVGHSGLVRFDPVGDGSSTRVTVRMSYNPPGGWVGHMAATLFGADAESLLSADLMRAKTLLETGRPARDAAQPDRASSAEVM